MASSIEQEDFLPPELHRKALRRQRANPGRAHSWYVLMVLSLVSLFNYLDRSIMGVLVQDIKTDLGLTDADMGFLGGAAFAVFYGTFGMAIGRLADVWNRTRLISLGLACWSLMTALSGVAQGFLSLAASRCGVGVGESTANPASISILYDYFPSRVRSTVIGIFNAGGAIGGGLGLFIGGVVLDTWNGRWPDASAAPFELKGWQAAFMVVGLPGLLMALWVALLREPARGEMDGIRSATHPHPVRDVVFILLSMVPVVNLWTIGRSGDGRRPVLINLSAALVIVAGACSLSVITGNALHWGVIGFGTYAVVCWAQAISDKDAVAFGIIFHCRTILYLLGGIAVTFLMTGMSFWMIPYFQRYHRISASEAGSVLGIGGMLMGVTGVILGGLLSDWLRARTARGKLYVILGGLSGSALSLLVMLVAESLLLAYAGALAFSIAFAVAAPPTWSSLSDLVLPRVRATISALYMMIVILVGAGLSPYFIGLISDLVGRTGVAAGDSLRQGMLWSLFGPVIGLGLIMQAIRNVESDEATLLERARLLGEQV